MRRMCCVCHKTYSNGAWRHMPVAIDEPVTHGYCPECFAEAMAEMQSVIAGQGRWDDPCVPASSWSGSITQGGACV